MPSVSIVDKLISQHRTRNQMKLFLNISRQQQQKKLESIVTWKKSRIHWGDNCLHGPKINEKKSFIELLKKVFIIHAFWTNSLRNYFENLVSTTNGDSRRRWRMKKKSDQNVSLFCCVVLFDDWYRCNETSSNTIIECNKRGTVAETLLPSLYVTWLIIAVANHMHAVTETNTHSGLDAANESDDDDDDAHGSGEHSHSHRKDNAKIQARPRTLPVNRRCMSGCAAWRFTMRDHFPSAFSIRWDGPTHPNRIHWNNETCSRAAPNANDVGYRPPFSLRTLTHANRMWRIWIEAGAWRFVCSSLRLKMNSFLVLGGFSRPNISSVGNASGLCVDAVIYFAQSKAHSVAAQRKRIQ